MAKPADTVHRVYPLPEALREALRTSREARGETTNRFVAEAVAAHLPGLLDQLRRLGFGPSQGSTKPVRLPFSKAAGTLQTLKEGSEQVGVPASQLLAFCLLAGTKEQPATRKGRRGRPRKTTAPEMAALESSSDDADVPSD